MKKITLIFATAILTVLMTMTVFAGTWKQDGKGWWWDRGNGTWPVSCWEWCDGNNDGIAECYYFGPDGYCYISTTTPDGFQVNEKGQWIENGIAKTQAVNSNADGRYDSYSDGDMVKITVADLQSKLKFPDTLQIHGIWKGINNQGESIIEVEYSALAPVGLRTRGYYSGAFQNKWGYNGSSTKSSHLKNGASYGYITSIQSLPISLLK